MRALLVACLLWAAVPPAVYLTAALVKSLGPSVSSPLPRVWSYRCAR